MSILLARTSSRKQIESRKILCFMLTTKTSTRCPGWRPWHCYEYDTAKHCFGRYAYFKNIVSADIFIKKQSYVSVNAHLHVYVFSCYFLRFTCVCIVRVVRVVCKWNTKSCNFKVTSYEIFFRDHVQCTTLHYITVHRTYCWKARKPN